MRGSIKHREYEVEYFIYGSGKKVLFAFHGFNNHAEDFKSFGDAAGSEYTIIAINIFFHGTSKAGNDLVDRGFSIDDMKLLFEEFADLFPSEKYTLMGYSLGGRLVLKFLEILPERIEKVILLAPDGIRLSSFYRFLTGYAPGRSLLRKATNDPGVFFRLAGMIRRAGLVSEKKYQFAIGNFDSEPKRQKVYLVWMILRKIISDKKKLFDIIRKYKIPVLLFFGKHDSIIPPSIGVKFQKGMEENISLHILEAGHRLLKEKSLQEVAQILNK